MFDERSANTPTSSSPDPAGRAPQSDERTPGQVVVDPVSEEDQPLQAEGGSEPVASSGSGGFSMAWQIPLVLLSTGLILSGFLMMRSRAAVPQDPAIFLEVAEQRIIEGRLEEARVSLQRASAALEVVAEAPNATALRGRMLLSEADLESRRSRIPRNDQRVLSLYEQAQSLGMRLTPEQEARRAAALAALGDHDAAFKTFFSGTTGVDSPESAHIRRRVLGVLAERARQGDVALRIQLVGHLDVYAAGAGVSLEDAAWAVTEAARLRLAAGEHETGLERLMRSVRRLESRQNEPDARLVMQDWLGRIQSVYGRLWLASGAPLKARDALTEALQQLPDGDEDRLMAEAALAELDRREGAFEEAIGRFGSILSRHPSTDARMEVHLYRAETYAANGDHELALADYAEALDMLGSGVHPMAERLTRSLEDRIQEQVLLGQPQRAIEYSAPVLDSSLLEVTDDVLRHAARAHRQLGESLLISALGIEAEELFDHDLVVVDPEVRREAASRFREAGTIYELFALRLHERNDARAGWSEVQASAAECFDLGADRVRAISAYSTYLSGTGVDNGDRARLAFKYAQALHSNLQFAQALSAYDTVVEQHGQGIFAAKSRVAGASCLVSLDRPREAQVRLELIISGSDGIRPEAPEFQEALYALGRLLHESQLHENAVARLDEAVRRYPTDPRFSLAAFMLGSSLESLALVERTRELDRTSSPSVRDAAREAWSRHTEAAVDAFGLVITEVGDRPEDAERQLLLRDARVGRANGLLDLGQYVQAIELYELIERRYRSETTSLDALVRLNEAWSALGRVDEAEKAHSRAVLRLRQLPEEVFLDSRFDRTGWTTWLERRPLRMALEGPLDGGLVQGMEPEND
ncbi:MAG: hypothetical protein CBC35_11445 [Planctomycetes bacterium TMED75]|nr:hypothetical protein [Planctomycetaceae bacterium]OUU90648.1 MAG: hypothetical protein CBC35_11445 [Planctomycetes bacterium TMED75]